jgi:hypothetical protein
MPTNVLGSFTLVARPLVPDPAAFDGTSTNIVNQPVGKWQFFRIDVPTNALGWDVRLVNVTSGDPEIVVRRDQLPESLVSGPSGWYPWNYTNWPSGAQWGSYGYYGLGEDWTRLTYDPTGVTNQNGRILAMGMGNPLEPGTYYVGVLNGSDLPDYTNAMSYTLLSRGIGPGMRIPVVDMPFAGGTAVTNGILPREAAYYRVVVPSNTPSWQVRLTPAVGDALLQVKWRTVPTINDYDAWYRTPYESGGKRMQKAGKEQWALLPENGTNWIAAGTYYLAAVSEGQNATNSDRIGTGSSGWTLASLGAVITNLGTVSAVDLVRADTVEGGALKEYRFTVPAGTESVAVRLENRVGNPLVAVIAGNGLPTVRSGTDYIGDPVYGNWGGQWPSLYDHSICTVVNPATGTYSVCVYGDDQADASYTLRVSAVIPANVSFDGGSNVVTGQPVGNWRFFKVQVPANALGWDVRRTSRHDGR